jgi:DNA-binding NtrC family response regulator
MDLLSAGEELICWNEGPLAGHFSAPDFFFFDDALRNAGVFGESRALRDLLDRLRELAKNRDPVLLAGAAGVGKRTFASLLHRLTDHDSTACPVVDCRDLPHSPGSRLLPPSLLQSLRCAIRPSLILLHPGVLPPDLRADLFTALLEKNQPIRPLVTADGSSLPALFRGLPPAIRRTLSAQSLDVPDLHRRREDLKPSILAKLGELNRRTGLRKQISAAALNRLLLHDYAQNFRTLWRILEKMHATQLGILTFDGDFAANCGLGPMEMPTLPRLEDGFNLGNFLDSLRGKIIHHSLDLAGHNQTRAARLLGITPQAVNKFLKNRLREKTKK